MNPWNSIPNIGEGRARTAMPEHGAPYGTPGSKVNIAPLLRPAPEVVPEVTSQEDEAFQALPAVTADEMRGAEGMSDQMNWAFDQATHDMHVRVAAGMADLADQMDGVFKPTPCPPLAPQVEEAAGSVFAGMKVVVDPTVPADELHFKYGDRLVGRIVNAAPPHDSLGEAQMAAGRPQEAQPATVPAAKPFGGRAHDMLWFDEMTATMQPDTKPTNPKDAVGDTRVPLSLLSPIAKAHWALAQHCGRTKYGAWNWREAGARASVYISAIQRHADGYLSGETNDPADGTHHLGNIMACCAILLEAEAAGKLQDDRPPVVGIREVYAAVEKQQAVLTAKYADRRPRHWTIGDTL